MPESSLPPIPVIAIRDHAIDSLLGGSAGWFRIPKGGRIACQWLSRSKAYRLTIDVVPGNPFSDETEAFLRELRTRIEATT